MWNLFKRETIKDRDLQIAYQNMQSELTKVGGKLSFILVSDENGWSAECAEFPIITGGSNSNPTEQEIMSSIVDAIKTAFDIPIIQEQVIQDQNIHIPKISVTREFQFC